MRTHSTTRDRREGVGPQKFLIGAAAILAAVNILGLGAYATWTDSEVDQIDIASGTLGIVLGADGPANRLYVDATDVAPGDRIQRVVELTNDGSIDLESITLSTSSATGSLLYTGADRLDLRIQACDTAWTETVEANGAYSYSCAGTASDVLGDAVTYADIQQTGQALSGLNATSAGGVDQLMIELAMPQSADNTYQAQSDTVTFTLDAVQRSGEFR